MLDNTELVVLWVYPDPLEQTEIRAALANQDHQANQDKMVSQEAKGIWDHKVHQVRLDSPVPMEHQVCLGHQDLRELKAKL